MTPPHNDGFDRMTAPGDDLFIALTDAILAGERNLDPISRRFGVPPQQTQNAIALISQMHTALTGVQPSRRFVRRLRSDLVGKPEGSSIINRVRYLPPRVQIVAGVLMIAGFMLFTRRRLMLEARGDAPEVSIAAR